MGGLPKLLKEFLYVDVWPFYGKVKFASLCICMSRIHLNGKIVENFKRPPLKPLSQFCSNFIWSHLRVGKRKIAKIVGVRWPRWQPCPYMVKTFKKSSSPESRMPWGWIFARIIGDERSTKVAKRIIVRWHLTFLTARSSLLPYAFVWAPYIWIGKLLRISKDFSSEATEPNLLKFHIEPS